MGYLTQGYDAAQSSTKRRNSGTLVMSSDQLLGDSDRRKIIESQRDLWRNFSPAAWAIRKHLDYVSQFSFHPVTQDRGLNEELMSIMRWWSLGENCDIGGRHSLQTIIRTAEARALIDGDVFLVKHRTGTLQAIEGDRVRNQGESIVYEDLNTKVHGVTLNKYGRPTSYDVYTKKRGTYTFERSVSADNMLHLGYFDSFDQVRGVSPLVSAVVAMHDVLEVKEYARLKAKVTQLFAMAVYNEQVDYNTDGDGDSRTGYDVDLGKGPLKLELEKGDRAEFLESRHPSTEFQAFITMSMQAAMKALDIPWSFYDEAYTNFFGSRAALIQYQQSCKWKRERIRVLLDKITKWLFSMFIVDGLLTLPSGMQLSDVTWEWIPDGVPWWNPEQEIAGDLAAIEAGLRTRSEVRRERYGDDWYEVARRKAAEDQHLRDLGLAVNTGYTAPVVQEEAVQQQEQQNAQ